VFFSLMTYTPSGIKYEDAETARVVNIVSALKRIAVIIAKAMILVVAVFLVFSISYSPFGFK